MARKSKQQKPSNATADAAQRVPMNPRDRLASMGISLDEVGSGVIPYTEDKAAKILCLIADGVPIDAACGACNVTKVTLQYWRSSYPAYDEAIEIALGHLHAEMAQVVVNAARMGDVDAARLMLERRFPEDWTPQQSVEVRFRRMSNQDLLEYVLAGGVDPSVDRKPLPLPGYTDDEGFDRNSEPITDGNVVREGHFDVPAVLDLRQTRTADTEVSGE